MKTFIYKIGLLIAVILTVVSCSKNAADYVAVIPNDAQTVVAFTVKDLAQKIEYKNLDDLKFVQLAKDELENAGEEAAVVKEIMDNPQKTGISISDKIYFFVAHANSGNEVAGFVAKMDDKSDFESLIAKLQESNTQLEKLDQGEYQILISGSDYIAYDDDKILFLNNRNGEEIIAQLMTQDKENSITSNEDFLQFNQEKYDIGVWVDYAVAKDVPMGILGLNSFDVSALKDSYAHINTVFKDDKVEAKMVFKPSDSLAKVMDEYEVSANFDTDLLKFHPKTPILFAGFSIQPNKLYQLIAQKEELKNHIPDIESELGISLEEFFKSFGGNLSVSFNGMTNQNPNFNVVFDVDGKEGFDQLIAALKNKNDEMLVDKGEYFELNDADNTMYISNKKDWAIITTDFSVLDKFNGKGYKDNFSNSDYKKVTDKPGFAYLNLDLESYPTSFTQSFEATIYYQKALSFSKNFKAFTITSEGQKEVVFTLEMANDDHNSLRTILNAIDENL